MPGTADHIARRKLALDGVGAVGELHTLNCYDVAVGADRVFIAQDDWLPEPGACDPVAAEWSQVLDLIGSFTPEQFPEPSFDHVTNTFLWTIPV